MTAIAWRLPTDILKYYTHTHTRVPINLIKAQMCIPYSLELKRTLNLCLGGPTGHIKKKNVRLCFFFKSRTPVKNATKLTATEYRLCYWQVHILPNLKIHRGLDRLLHIVLLGCSGGVVNSLDFCLASLKSLSCFYFWFVLSSQWKAVTVNLLILHCQL